MVLETIAGGAIGALARLAPEVMKVWDRRNERKHEAVMLDKTVAAEQARAAAGLKETEAKADSAQMLAAIAALQEAVKGQAQATGIKWVDAITATVRPFLTYGIVAPYAFGKSVVFFALCWVGFSKLGIDASVVKEALAATYTDADMAIVSGVLNFWFIGRVFDKRGS